MFFLTVLILSIGYAAIGSTWTAPNTLEAGAGSGFTASAWNKLLANFNNLDTRVTNLDSNLTSQFSTHSSSNTYTAITVPLTAAPQNFATVMTLPSAGTYLIWINARLDLWAGAGSHFFLSTTPAGSYLFWYNYISNPSGTMGTNTFSNMWILSVAGPTTIYAGWLNGVGTLNFGLGQSAAGYLKLK